MALGLAFSVMPPGMPAPLDPPTPPARVATADATTTRPLAGRVIVLDPGHQLGNRRHARDIGRLVDAGGFTKPCNTTGTATNGGFPEATLTWSVARRLEQRLEDLGARVVLTRTANSDALWGPCVDTRGRAGAKAGADLELSIHGDGSTTPGAHGFHVIAPADRAPWTSDVYAPSRRLALAVRSALHGAGFPYATYLAGGDGYDTRGDLGTLNLSDVPIAMVELGNMRSSTDARVMTSAAGRDRYAAALAKGVVAYLG